MIYAFTAIKMRRYTCYLTRNMNVPKIKISFLLHLSPMIMKSESFYEFLSIRLEMTGKNLSFTTATESLKNREKKNVK